MVLSLLTLDIAAAMRQLVHSDKLSKIKFAYSELERLFHHAGSALPLK